MLLVLAHANGFCREVWRAVEAEVRKQAPDSIGQRLQFFAPDLPGHGSTGPPLAAENTGTEEMPLADWEAVGAHILSGIQEKKAAAAAAGEPPPVVIGVGHSLGGAGCVLAELRCPGTFTCMLLWEPILFDPDQNDRQKKTGSSPDKAKLAARRRSEFESPHAMLEWAATKPLFRHWDARALEGYIEGGLKPEAASKGGWALACRPSTEAAYFASFISRASWLMLTSGRQPRCRTHIMIGQTTNIRLLSESYYQDKAFGGNQNISVETVDGAGHLGPMEDPKLFATSILKFITGACPDTRCLL
eukprot:SAG31_NODE_184_length_20985_cov_28.867567_5_plen_303_part_00